MTDGIAVLKSKYSKSKHADYKKLHFSSQSHTQIDNGYFVLVNVNGLYIKYSIISISIGTAYLLSAQEQGFDGFPLPSLSLHVLLNGLIIQF